MKVCFYTSYIFLLYTFPPDSYLTDLVVNALNDRVRQLFESGL